MKLPNEFREVSLGWCSHQLRRRLAKRAATEVVSLSMCMN